MSCKILVVEDEIFVATEIEHVIEDMGHEPVGIAPDQRSALSLASETEVALIDLNLQDGPTGLQTGRILAQTHGVAVVYMTANPAQLGKGVPGTVGVLPKPVTDTELRDVIQYAVSRRQAADAVPPSRLQLFGFDGASPA